MPFSRLEHDFIMQHCCCLNCKFMTLHKLYTVLKVPLKYNKPQVENVARGRNSVRLTYMVTSISTYIHLFSSARRPATLRAGYTNRLNPENNRCIRNVPLPLYRPRTGAISGTWHNVLITATAARCMGPLNRPNGHVGAM